MSLLEESNQEHESRSGLLKELAVGIVCTGGLIFGLPFGLYHLEQARQRTHVMVAAYEGSIGSLSPQDIIQSYYVARTNNGITVRRTAIPFQTSWYDDDNDGKVDRKEQGCVKLWGGQVARGFPEVTSRDQDLFERVVAQAIRENKIN